MSRRGDRRAPPSLLLCAVGLAAIVAGCATTSDLERLELRVVALEGHREALEAKMAEDVGRLETLHAGLSEAEQTLRKSGANLGLRMDNVEAELPRLRGDLDAAGFNLTRTLRDIEILKREMMDRLGSTAVFLPADLPKAPDDVWKLAADARASAKRREAQALFDYFEANFRDDPRADDALMAIARMREEDGDSAGAIKTYQRVHDDYPQGDQVTVALSRIATLFVARGDCARAKGVYDYLARVYKDTPDGVVAASRSKVVLDECASGSK